MIAIQKTVSLSGNLDFASCTINKDAAGNFTATVNCVLRGADGAIIEGYRKVYSGLEFNTFWTNFNSGTFLLEQIVEDVPLPVTTPLPTAVERTFANVVAPGLDPTHRQPLAPGTVPDPESAPYPDPAPAPQEPTPEPTPEPEPIVTEEPDHGGPAAPANPVDENGNPVTG